MAQEVHDKIVEIRDLIDGGEDVFLAVYQQGEKSQLFYKGRSENLVAQIAAAMVCDNRFAKIVEVAYDAYTAHEMNEKLKNKEL